MTDQFKIGMRAQFWTWKRKNLNICSCNHKKHTGKCKEKGCTCKKFERREEIGQVQGALREWPWGYEYIFPEEHLDEVLTMLHIKERHQLPKFSAWVVRKCLGYGVKKIPKYKETYNLWSVVDGKFTLTPRYVEMHGVAVYPIGIKEDNRTDWDDEGYWQEMI